MDGSRLDGFVLSSRGRKRLPTQFLPTSMACRTPTGTPISPILRGVYLLRAGVHKGLDLRKLRSTCPGSPHRMPAGADVTEEPRPLHLGVTPFRYLAGGPVDAGPFGVGRLPHRGGARAGPDR